MTTRVVHVSDNVPGAKMPVTTGFFGIIGSTKYGWRGGASTPLAVVERRRRSPDMGSIPIPSRLQHQRDDINYLRSLTSDEFAEELIRRHLYDVDPHTARVVNLATGQELSPIRKSNGYMSVTWYAGNRVSRQLSVHRLVALKAFGIDAIRGRQVGHRNHDKSDNGVDNLWIPESAKAHFAHDAPDRHNQDRTKQAWEPCAACGDPNGPSYRASRTPSRHSGTPYGIDGEVCRRCLVRLKGVVKLSDAELISVAAAVQAEIERRSA